MRTYDDRIKSLMGRFGVKSEGPGNIRNNTG